MASIPPVLNYIPSAVSGLSFPHTPLSVHHALVPLLQYPPPLIIFFLFNVWLKKHPNVANCHTNRKSSEFSFSMTLMVAILLHRISFHAVCTNVAHLVSNCVSPSLSLASLLMQHRYTRSFVAWIPKYSSRLVSMLTSCSSFLGTAV